MFNDNLIEELESRNDEYHLCRANHLKKRSIRFRTVTKRALLKVDENDKYILPEFPSDPKSVSLIGARFPITTFVVHGREIIWTGSGQTRPPREVLATYDCWKERRIHSE